MKTYILSLLIASALFADTYDNLYSLEKDTEDAVQITDLFLDGRYSEIKRFDAIYADTSPEDLNKTFTIIKEYTATDKNISISVIGHSGNHCAKEAMKESEELSLSVAKKLEDNNISKEIIFPQHRGSKDLGYTTGTNDGVELSNRVMLSMYVLKPKDTDDDLDGVFNETDQCQNTPENVNVDQNGCPLDLDKDLVPDYKDECLNTPTGAQVDDKGCPFDSDNDGVLDHKDICLDTPQGFRVDSMGCPIVKDVRLNFTPKSSEIPKSSYNQVVDFATFLKKNKQYNVQVLGHTDSVGKAGVNMTLSFERAHSLKQALVKEGIAGERIEAVGRGELEPIETNRTDEGRALNRRLEVKLFK